MTTFSRTWDSSYESSPANGQNVKQGAARIRENKVDIRERLTIDHQFGNEASTSSNSGYHKKVTLIEGSNPTVVANAGILFTKDVSGVTELFYMDSAGTVQQMTVGGVLTPPTVYEYLTLTEQASEPANVANKGIIYSKDVGGLTELFYTDSAGTEQQITTNGKLKPVSSQIYSLSGKYGSNGATILQRGFSGATRTATGRYTIAHSIGNSDYYPQATAITNDTGVTCVVYDIQDTSYKIRIDRVQESVGVVYISGSDQSFCTSVLLP